MKFEPCLFCYQQPPELFLFNQGSDNEGEVWEVCGACQDVLIKALEEHGRKAEVYKHERR
jgi:hypothetical protein